MTPKAIKKILKDFEKGEISEKEVLQYLKFLPFKDLNFAKIDHHRALRRGLPEVIFGQDKTKEQIVKITKEIAKYNDVLVTKTNKEVFAAIKKVYKNAIYNEIAKTVIIKRRK